MSKIEIREIPLFVRTCVLNKNNERVENSTWKRNTLQNRNEKVTVANIFNQIRKGEYTMVLEYK